MRELTLSQFTRKYGVPFHTQAWGGWHVYIADLERASDPHARWVLFHLRDARVTSSCGAFYALAPFACFDADDISMAQYGESLRHMTPDMLEAFRGVQMCEVLGAEDFMPTPATQRQYLITHVCERREHEGWEASDYTLYTLHFAPDGTGCMHEVQRLPFGGY